MMAARWTFRRRLACFFGEQLVPGRHHPIRGTATEGKA